MTNPNGRFGIHGGQYIPETLMNAVIELEEAYNHYKNDPEFNRELTELFNEYAGRPSRLYYAQKMTQDLGGAKIYLKREDLNHTGAHKINNVLSQALNVYRMRLLGAEVIPVKSGTGTLKDAVSEAMREWTSRIDDTHYCLGSVMGPHPFPTIVRDFQAVISREIKEQLMEKEGKLPDAVIACVVGGSNAIGSFYHFIEDDSVRLIGCEAAGGADLIELGIPFSDPTAEGPVIQGANIRALKGGITTDDIFSFVRELREDIRIPMVFMTYSNVVFSYGADRFISTCRDIGIDGLILPDLPYEEKEEFLPFCHQYDVDLISLIAPTSEDRIAMIAREAEGFLYIVSSLGVTGTRSEIKTDLAAIIAAVRQNTNIPCAIGFGISTPEQAKKMADLSDGAIVGSAIIKLLKKYGKDAPKYIGEYVKTMKDAIR